MTERARISDYVLPLVREPSSAQVRGVFGHGLDVVRDDGRMLYLGGFDRPLSCVGAQLPAADLGRVLSQANAGDAVLLGESRVRVLRAGAEVASVSLMGAEAVPLRVTAPLTRDAREDLVARIEACGLSESCGLPWDAGLRCALAGLDAGDAGELAEAVRWLYGRGLGLTPSGDDILTGFGCGLAAAGRPRRRQELVGAVRAVSETRRTTYVSDAYLDAMAAGRVNESYFDLVRDARVGVVTSAHIRAVREVGHTSGDDMLLGFGLALGVRYPGVGDAR